MPSKWFKKRALADIVLTTIGVCPKLFSMLSDKLHEDDVGGVARYLNTTHPMVREALYEECEAPGGVVPSKELN